VEVLEGTLEKERAGARESASVTTRLAAEKDGEIAGLKKKIAELPTSEEYAKVKRQLRVVQAVEYNMLDSDTLEEGGGSAGDNNDLDEAGRETLRLEEMLMAKNKQLEKRVAESNRLMDTKVEELRLLQLRERTLEAKVEEQVTFFLPHSSSSSSSSSSSWSLLVFPLPPPCGCVDGAALLLDCRAIGCFLPSLVHFHCHRCKCF